MAGKRTSSNKQSRRELVKSNLVLEQKVDKQAAIIAEL
jgi:hypothetical protein